MIDQEYIDVMEGMQEVYRNEKEPVPPKCHFTHMEVHACDLEEWYECKHCGHTELIRVFSHER